MNVKSPTPGQWRFFLLALTALAAAFLIAFACTVVWGLGKLLDVLSPVLWPLALGGVVACLLSPLVDWLEKRNVPRQRGIMLVFVVVCGLVAAVLASVIPQLVEETQELVAKVPEYSTKLQERIARLTAQPPEFLRHFFPAPQNAKAANAKDQAIDSAFGWLSAHGSVISSWLFKQSDKVTAGFSLLAGLALVPVYAFYFLLEKGPIESHWKEYLPVQNATAKKEVIFVVDAINRYLVAFFRGQVLVAICDSILYTIGFLAAGLNYAFLLGFAALLLTMIPFLGALILCVAALVLALVQFGDWTHPLIILGIVVVVQSLEAFFISPKIIGDRVGLHPLVIIVAVMTGTTLLGGILGGILAIPLAAALRVILYRYVWKVREKGE
jgi:predicted PurR-regulated permease PerM